MTTGTSINYTEKSYEEIFTYILTDLRNRGLLSTDLSISDIVNNPQEYSDYVVVMDAANFSQEMSQAYHDLTLINNNLNMDKAAANTPLQITDALAVLGKPFIGDPYPSSYANTMVTFHTETAPSTDIIIMSGTVIASEKNPAITFKTASNAILVTGETDVDVMINCTIPGPAGNVAANTLTILESHIDGVDAVNNVNAATGGSMGETPTSYISRFRNWQYSNIRGTYAALVNAIKSVPQVTGFYIDPHPTVSGVVMYGVVNVTIDPPTDSVLAAVKTAIIGWKAVKENVNISGAIETPIDINVSADFDLNAPAPYSETELAQFSDLIKNYLTVYINGGLNRDGTTRPELGIGRDFTKSAAITYVSTQVPEIQSLVLTLSPNNEVISILADERAIAGTITVTST